MKLYRTDPDHTPVPLRDLQVTSGSGLPLTDPHIAAMERLECGDEIELLWPDDVYGVWVRCCGDEAEWAIVQTLEGVVGTDEAYFLARQLPH